MHCSEGCRCHSVCQPIAVNVWRFRSKIWQKVGQKILPVTKGTQFSRLSRVSKDLIPLCLRG